MITKIRRNNDETKGKAKHAMKLRKKKTTPLF